MNEIKLAWPHKNLSPNTKCHWTVYYKYAKRAKIEAAWVLREAELKIPAVCHLVITFVRNDARRFDLDNALASLKSALDGLAEQSGVDDAEWSHQTKKRVDRSTPYKYVLVQWSVDSDAV